MATLSGNLSTSATCCNSSIETGREELGRDEKLESCNFGQKNLDNTDDNLKKFKNTDDNNNIKKKQKIDITKICKIFCCIIFWIVFCIIFCIIFSIQFFHDLSFPTSDGTKNPIIIINGLCTYALDVSLNENKIDQELKEVLKNLGKKTNNIKNQQVWSLNVLLKSLCPLNTDFIKLWEQYMKINWEEINQYRWEKVDYIKGGIQLGDYIKGIYENVEVKGKIIQIHHGITDLGKKGFSINRTTNKLRDAEYTYTNFEKKTLERRIGYKITPTGTTLKRIDNGIRITPTGDKYNILNQDHNGNVILDGAKHDFITPNFMSVLFANILQYRLGYGKENIAAIPYDWRLGPTDWKEDGEFIKAKNIIEYYVDVLNEGKPAIIFGISMGNMCILFCGNHILFCENRH